MQQTTTTTTTTQSVPTIITDLVVQGKHKGKRYQEVYNEDPNYCIWLLSQQDLSSEFAGFHTWLTEQPKLELQEIIPYFTKGKHNGKNYKHVFDTDKHYTKWVEKLTDARGELYKYQQWVKNQETEIISV